VSAIGAASAVCFDLDDTLIVERRAADEAFVAAAARAAPRGIAPEALAASARLRARELWQTSPAHGYCRLVGVSSWEGLWARFDGDCAELAALRAWAPGYRAGAWRLALRDHGCDDAALAAELADAFQAERRARHQCFPDAGPLLAALRGRRSLALITNGLADLQREKLRACGLEEVFDVVVVSADVGAGKPDGAVFRRALELLRVSPANAVMIGDSWERDVLGARAAGMTGILLDRSGESAGVPASERIGGLHELAERGSRAGEDKLATPIRRRNIGRDRQGTRPRRD
jgi:putative hydrolase of the HAD superfamily